MIFRPGLADLIVRGEKTATRRMPTDNPRSPWFRGGCTYRRGQVFAVQAGQGKRSVALAEVDRVALERLDEIRPSQAHAEGVRNAAAFFELWREIYGPIVPGTWVWVVELHVTVRL